ncbi:MFS transporter [Pseudonocardia hierapolitana]|uniref:MFS transporter n=1 Tax=Pseudonocardia hierapolitana TaxID=1128676 RepID=A0A561SR28_9PSEU|nr:MFS transporter [Pseudonocardia hierapolitana]TWF77330.1 MFS transporter [Pseudonocardia hierapolitana]
MVGWALLADVVPFYPLYALLFTATGLSVAQVSALFAIWSAVAMLAEVPSGALADRFSRRSCLVAAGVLQAGGYAAWVLLPGFPGFALGFVLWGFGGSLVSGAKEALLYDGLDAAGAAEHYARVAGWVSAMELVAQLPAALAATWLFVAGGFPLVGWVSVGTCLAAAGVAATLPEPPRRDVGGGVGYVATLRTGLGDAARIPGLRPVLLAVAVLAAYDAVEEYFPLLLADWGIPLAAVPLAAVPIVLGGTAGAALGGVAARLPAWLLGVVLGAAMVLLGAAGLGGHPAGVVAVAAFYGGYRALLVVLDARLQERIASATRATVTSVAGLGTELATFGVYAAWAVGGAPLLAAGGLLIAMALPVVLRGRVAGSGAPGIAATRQSEEDATAPSDS